MKTRSSLRAPAASGLILLLIVAAIWLSRNHEPGEKPESPVSRVEKRDVETSHKAAVAAFSGWIETYARTTPGQRDSLLTEGVKLARERRATMEALMTSDPKAALASAVTLDTWQALPPEIRAETEEPFSMMARYRVMPVCLTGSPDAGKLDHSRQIPDAVRWLETEGSAPLETFVFGRRNGISSKDNAPVQGIRLGTRAVLREEVFHQLNPAESRVAERIYPLANPAADKDFASGAPLGDHPVVALSGGRIFKFADQETLDSFGSAIAALDEKTGPKGGSGVLFLPSPANGATGGFDLAGAVALNNTLASAWTETKKKVFMIRCDFPDKPDSGFPVVNAGTYGTMLNTTVSNDIRDYSYGKTWIEATVSSDITRLPQTAAYYAQDIGGGSTRNSDLLNNAKAAYQAAHPSFVPSSYDIIGIWFVSIGMKGSGVTYAGLAGGGDLWIQGTSDAGVHVHEFGHNYGIGHSSFWVRSSGSTNPADPAGSNEEYGDPFDVMGGGPVPEGVFHAEAKQRLNWLSTGQWVDATAAGSATHRLYQIDHPDTTGTRGIRVTRGAGDYYWLSYRRLFNNTWLHAGANIVWKQAGEGRSWLIDTTPGSLSGSADRTDGSIAIGRTYSDGNSHVTPLGRGGDSPQEWLDIRVNTGPFPGNVAPAVTLSGPSSINARQTCVFTAQATDANGDALSYSWDFGLGFTFDNHPKAAFSWASGGTYTVKVTVSDMKGMTTQATKTVTVTDSSTTWTNRTTTSTGDFQALVASPTRVLAIGSDYESFQGPIAYSADGTTWTSTQIPSYGQLYGGVWDGSKFIIVGEDYSFDLPGWVGTVYTSPTGNAGTWTQRHYGGPPLRAIATGGGVHVAVGASGSILRSTDGITWTSAVSGTSNMLRGIAHGDGKFVAVGYMGGSGTVVVLHSSNGTTWTNATATAGSDVASWQDLRTIVRTGDRFIASGWYGRIRYSTDGGVTFPTSRPAGENTPAIAYGNGLWFAAGLRDANTDDETDIDLISTDGATWTELPTPSQPDRNAAIFFNNTFITVGDDATIRQSGTLSGDASGYHVWRETHFPDHQALTTPDADYDGDGIDNLLEYALGLSPVSPNGVDGVAGLPRAGLSTDPVLAGRLVLEADLRNPIATDLVHIIEGSPTMTSGSWQTLATKTGEGAWVWSGGGSSRVVTGAPAGGRTPVKIGDAVTIDSTPARFLRLKTRVNQ